MILSSALIAGLGIALITGVMGCFVVWRRMAYFGDSLSQRLIGYCYWPRLWPNHVHQHHCCLSVIFFAALWAQHRGVLTDTTGEFWLMGHFRVVSSCSALCGCQLIIVCSSVISTVNNTDLMMIFTGAVITLGLLIKFWNALILTTVSEDLAKAEGINTSFYAGPDIDPDDNHCCRLGPHGWRIINHISIDYSRCNSASLW